METIYYCPIDGEGNEMGETFPITLQSNGIVDLSQLPIDMAKTYEAYGVPDELHMGRVFPNQGEVFLEALLRSSDEYVRFRSSIGFSLNNPFVI